MSTIIKSCIYFFLICARIESSHVRLLAVSILFFAFLTQHASRLYWVADYYINPTAYIKNCENKAKPKLSCKGKCQMSKKIKEEEQKDQEQQERRNQEKNETLSSRSFFPVSQQLIVCSTITQGLTWHDEGRLRDHFGAVFHPPQV